MSRCSGPLAALLLLGCGSDGLRASIDDPVCGTEALNCAAAGFLCGQQTLKDSCGHSITADCGSCGPDASCVLGGLMCSCNTGYSGDGYTCTATIGSPCPAGDWTRHNCPAGQVCISSNGVNFCDIVNCNTDLECGTNGIAANSCTVTGGTPVCQLNCFPSVPNACVYPDFVCLPPNSGVVGDASACAISCLAEPASWCAETLFGSTCNANGFCEQVPCTDDANCPTGQICSASGGGPLSTFCAPDCRLPGNSCPPYATLCEQTTGQCD